MNYYFFLPFIRLIWSEIAPYGLMQLFTTCSEAENDQILKSGGFFLTDNNT